MGGHVGIGARSAIGVWIVAAACLIGASACGGAGPRHGAAAPLLLVDGAGHPPFLGRPDVFFPAVEAFLGGDWPPSVFGREPADIPRG